MTQPLAVFSSVRKTGFVHRLHGGGTDPGCLGTVSLQREQGGNINRVRMGVWTGGNVAAELSRGGAGEGVGGGF